MNTQRPIFREDESSQIPALQLLQNMGYTYLEPEEALRLRNGNIRNVVLEEILENQLREINKINYKGSDYEFRDVNISNAIYELKTIPFEGLIKTSEKIFDLLTLGKSYTETIAGDRKSYNFKYIDWETPENNVFHVTEEYNVETSSFDGKKRRPDIILFVNGIPLVIIECKRPDLNDPIEEAVEQHIRNQKNHEIPHLYVFSQVLLGICPTNISSKNNRCMYATTGTPRPFWYPWKEKSQFKTELERQVNTPLPDEKKNKLFSERYWHVKDYFEELEKAPRQITDQDQILFGLCSKERLLEVIKKFVLYDAGTKKIARYQQYFSVNDTIARLVSVKPQEKRPNGVIWHTQGSGKSLSMVMLAKSIAMENKIAEPKIILVTDRVDLDEQIYRTFQNCQVPLKQAASGAELIKILNSNKAAVIATTIFKFDKVANSKGTRLDSNDIIILVDEAHRTQYGQASAKVHKVFPNACFIGYTGTPLAKKNKNTMKQFGNIIGSPYTSRDALDDKAIVPLLYEGRIVPQDISKDLLDRMFERFTKRLTPDQQADLKRKYNRADQLAKVNQRIFMIAADVSEHYLSTWKGTGFKGQLAANSIASALKYKAYFDELGEISTAVIISKTDDRKGHQSPDEDESALHKYERMVKEQFGNNKKYEKEMIAKFDSDEGPDLLIVVHKLLTGFDVQRNTVLYIDRAFEESHNLLQATARVNRTYHGKEFGYIIDYYGNLKNFQEAIAKYDDLAKREKIGEFDQFERDEIESAIHEIGEEIQKLPQHYADLIDLFCSVINKSDLSAYEEVLFEKEERDTFYERLSLFGRALHQALSSVAFITQTSEKKVKEYKDELKFFEKLKAHIKQVFAESIDYRDYEPKIEKLLNTHVHAEPIKTIVPMFEIYDKRFESELDNKNTQSKALTILNRTKRYIDDNLERDRVFYERFSKLLQETLDNYHQKRIKESELLATATDLKEKVLSRTGDELPSVLNGKGEPKAFYGIIKKVLDTKNDFKTEQLDGLANMSIDIDKIIKDNIIVDWTKNLDIQNKLKNQIEDYIFDKKAEFDLAIDFDAIDRIMEEIIKTAKVRCPK